MNLPLAVGIDDLLGILVLLVFAILSVLGKKFSGQREEETEEPRPGRPVPPRQPLPPQAPGPQPPVPDFVGEMKRFLEEMKKEQEQRPAPAPPPLPAERMRPLPPPIRRQVAAPIRFGPPRRPSRPAAAPAVAPLPESAAAAARSSLVQTSIREDLSQSARNLKDEISVSHAELSVGSAPATVTSAPARETRPAGGSRFDRSMLDTPAGLRQAFVAAEILGRPKAFTG